jgi:hypothetical protein
LKALTVQQKIVFANHEGVFVRRVSAQALSRCADTKHKRNRNGGDETIQFHRGAFRACNAKMFTPEPNAGNSKAAERFKWKSADYADERR